MVRSARPGELRDEDDRVAALAAAADLGDPVGHAAGELERRLTGDVQPHSSTRQRLERGRAARATAPTSSHADARAPTAAATRLPLASRLVVAGAGSAAVSFSPCARTSSGSETSTIGRAVGPQSNRRPSPNDPACRGRRAAPAAARSQPGRAPRSIAASPGRRCGSIRSCRRRTRAGSARGAGGKKSTTPPRTQNSPCSSTGSWRV